MSLMKSLARVAAGVALAKGVGHVMRQSQAGGTARPADGQIARGQPRPGGGGLLGDLLFNNLRGGASGGSLGDMLTRVLGGSGGAGTGRSYGGPRSTGASGGLGGILDQLAPRAGRPGGTGSGGGYGDLLGGLAGGAAAGGLGGMLGGILGGPAQRGSQPRNDATFGEVLNDAMVHQDEPEVTPTPEQNAVAGLMLRAMIQATKADGRVDEAERERLLGHLGDLDDADRNFIREQMAAPVDARALAREVPKGLEAQVYTMSVLAIDLDHEDEAAYLRELAQALGLRHDAVDEIHEKIGVRNLYG